MVSLVATGTRPARQRGNTILLNCHCQQETSQSGSDPFSPGAGSGMAPGAPAASVAPAAGAAATAGS